MAVLGLRSCARAFSSCGKWGPLSITVRGPLTIMASLVADHRLQTCRLSNCGSWAQLLRGMWDLPRPGLKPVSPALAGRFSTTAPPGKPRLWYSLSFLDLDVCFFMQFKEVVSHYFFFQAPWSFLCLLVLGPHLGSADGVPKSLMIFSLFYLLFIFAPLIG